MFNGYEKSNFVKECSYGATFNVSVPGLEGHEESEEYFCPECLCMYTVRASNSPTVRLISPRTDGKTFKHPSPYED